MTLARRLWIYQAERFPLKKTVPLLAVFSAASLCVSATLADRPLPGAGAFAAAFIVALLLFFQLRVCDEWKDAEDDRRYRPDRPIPRGLVGEATILGLGAASMPVAALAAWAWHPPVLFLLALVWVWLAAMTMEFGTPAWLKSRPLLYLVSHMAIMPLIDLALTGMEWLPGGGADPDLWLFLALSFVNGCVLEIGRKLWAPESEIKGVDSYSGLWGPDRAARVWLAVTALAGALLIALGFAMGTGWPTVALTLPAFLLGAAAMSAYRAMPTPETAARMDTMSGLWVFFAYATAGFLPLLVGALGWT